MLGLEAQYNGLEGAEAKGSGAILCDKFHRGYKSTYHREDTSMPFNSRLIIALRQASPLPSHQKDLSAALANG